MSRRARHRAAAIEAKHVALVPLPEREDDDEPADEPCPECHGDGMDPGCDYLLPCPLCQGEQRP